MTKQISCRKAEVAQLKALLGNDEPQFIALYGRRRIGKTYLIREFFGKSAGTFMEVTGLKNGKRAEQLAIFNKAFISAFNIQLNLATPKTWVEAFEQLTTAIKQTPEEQAIFLFFDELPWLATKRSGLIQAIDHYWNSHWSKRKKLFFIACGSAAAWMINNLINDKGGLHNRITAQLHLQPFTLQQTKAYLLEKQIHLTDEQILQIYMVIGGVPHYLNQFNKQQSFIKTIDNICFNKNGLLYNEYNNLFSSLFDNHEAHILLIKEISKHTYGIKRDELIKKIKATNSGGRLTKRLDELEKAGFITTYSLYGYKNRASYYRVIDQYVLFYLQWIEKFKKQFKLMPDNLSYWTQQYNTPAFHTWRGYSFEIICLKHIGKIIHCLGLENLIEGIGPWRFTTKQANQHGAQIDLLLNRIDGFITICEIKANTDDFIIDKQYAENLRRKISVVEEKFGKKALIAFISMHELKKNPYSNRLVSATLTLEDLFKNDASWN